MHKIARSIRKRWHSLTINPREVKKLWQDAYWHEDEAGIRNISCRHCPRMNTAKKECTVKFGTPLRKCVVASVEAHLHDCRDKHVLEIGYGQFPLAKNLIKRSGGVWTGIDPEQPETKKAVIGRGGYGLADEIPFADNTFDMICGVQTIVHWGQRSNGDLKTPADYKACVNEIFRVLKPGGKIYFDMPIHLHGHEMFIMADIDRIKNLFPSAYWENLVIEKWRYYYDPLEKYAPHRKLFPLWELEISSYPAHEVEKAKNEPIHLLTVTARKIISTN